MTTKKDYYHILGVPKTATTEEIKKAYRNIAKTCHPDIASDKSDKFKDATEAYEVLSDDSKRAAYDRPSHNMFSGGHPGFGPDFFNSFFSINQKSRFVTRPNPDIRAAISVNMGQAYVGFRATVKFDRQIECQGCLGRGLMNAKNTKCTACNGTGHAASAKCMLCSGSGNIRTICPDCHGAGKFQEVGNTEITVPPGIKSGTQVVVKGAGNKMSDGKLGDLFVHIAYQPSCDGVSCNPDGTLHKLITVPWDSALLGEKHNFKVFPSCDNLVSITLDSTVPSGGQMRLNGLGMSGKDLVIKVWYTLPSNMNKVDREEIARIIRNAKPEKDRGKNPIG